MEKEPILKTSNKRSMFWAKTVVVSALALGGLVHLCGIHSEKPLSSEDLFGANSADLCPETKKLVPSGDGDYYDLEYFRSPEYQNYSVKVWGDAVRVDTTGYDDMGAVGEDPRWDVFYKFEDYVLKTFPVFTKKAELVHVNTHGLVFILHGSDESLKPIMLTGHQDVVPVSAGSLADWTYPPFDGHFDGEFLYGRGSCDCKNTVVAVLEALEALVKQGYKPKRSVVVALGFDEETEGIEGASHIGPYLKERFGENGIGMIVDEGWGVEDVYGAHFAFPAMGEKGELDVTIDLYTSGGHSSMPPDHTGIGIMGELSYNIESEGYSPRLPEDSPLFKRLQCEAKYGTKMPLAERADIKLMAKGDKLAKKRIVNRLHNDFSTKYFVGTSQSQDIIAGGDKVNSLPEKVTLTMNHRIAYGSSVQEVKDRLTKLTKKVADKYHLEVYGFDNETVTGGFGNPTAKGRFVLSSPFKEWNPAPITPSVGGAWELLAGTTRHVFEDFAVFPNSDEDTPSLVTVSPSVMTPNTDTRFYWALTPNIFRFTPGRMDRLFNYHTVNEKAGLDAHIEIVAWYYQFLRNAEQYGTDF